jgi:hypothetical protein
MFDRNARQTTVAADLIACIGSYGQRLYLAPSQKLVIVRLAKGSKPNDAQMLRILFATALHSTQHQ